MSEESSDFSKLAADPELTVCWFSVSE